MELDPQLPGMTEDLRGELAWTPGTGWLAWNGAAWDSRFGKDTAVDRVNRWREESGHKPLPFRQMIPVLRQLQAALSVEESALDAHPDLLNVQNGVVDLRTGKLRPHDPTLYLTKVAGVDYDPEARTAAWNRVLAALPSGAHGPVGSFIASALSGHFTGSAAVVHGPGLSGKSSFFRPLYEALGDHALHVSNWPQAGDLRGVRFVVAEDIERLNPAQLRLLLAGDLIAARQPNRAAMTFRPSHSLALVMGPQSAQGLDEGTLRRLKFIGFDRLADPDPGLLPLLKEPGTLRAALAWAVHQATSTARDA
jgi:putative DNA primase/helicase